MIERKDENIKVNIVQQLDWNSSVDASNVKVEVNDGKAVLSGIVSYYTNKKAAEDSAWLIPGVTEVVNKIMVKYPESVKIPTDDDIKRNVNNMILWDSDVFSFEINADVKNGVVELTGTVDALWKKYHIENLISGILGVMDVDNKIAVVPSDRFEDKIVAENITDAVDRLKVVDSTDITVEVENGIVTLSGEAPSWISKRSIENTADFTAGVIDVKNYITINY